MSENQEGVVVSGGPIRFMALKVAANAAHTVIAEDSEKRGFDTKLGIWLGQNPTVKKGDVVIRRVTTEYVPDFAPVARY